MGSYKNEDSLCSERALGSMQTEQVLINDCTTTQTAVHCRVQSIRVLNEYRGER